TSSTSRPRPRPRSSASWSMRTSSHRPASPRSTGAPNRVSAAVFFKLLAIFGVVGIGWFAGRMRWLRDERQGADPARTLSNAAFYIFIPALLFRATSRIDFTTLPWGLLAAFFGPVLLMLIGVYVWQRRLHRERGLPVAAPSVRAISCTFGNTLQIGVPM